MRRMLTTIMPNTPLRGLNQKTLLFLLRFLLSVSLVCTPAVCSAQAPYQASASSGQMKAAWDQLMSTAIPQAVPDPAFARPRAVEKKSGVDEFLERFHFESNTNYEHYKTGFTGNPTTAGVIDAPLTITFNPAGIPSPTAFQPGADRMEEFLDFGTTGYGSERVRTHVAMRYWQDLNTVQPGSPGENVIETFPGRRLYELLDANVEIIGKPSEVISGSLHGPIPGMRAPKRCLQGLDAALDLPGN